MSSNGNAARGHFAMSEEAQRMQRVVAEIRRDVNAWAVEHVTADGVSEETLGEFLAFFDELARERLPEYALSLLNPRIEGPHIVADGIVAENRE